VDHSPIEVHVIPRELAQLARAQAEGNRDDEQRLEPAPRSQDAVTTRKNQCGTPRDVSRDVGASEASSQQHDGLDWLMPIRTPSAPMPPVAESARVAPTHVLTLHCVQNA
jgi:hypothetical protein